MSLWDDDERRAAGELDDDGDGRAPICPSCGVTALPKDPSNVIDTRFMCENPDCEAYGDEV